MTHKFSKSTHTCHDTLPALINVTISIGHKNIGPVNINWNKGHTCIIGPNGAGKSTLLRYLNVEIPNNLGAYYGETYRSFLSQQNIIHWALRVQDVLNISHKTSHEHMHKIIDQMQIRPWLSMRTDHLSDGQRLKVRLARTFISDAHWYLLDEPTASLDPPEETRIFRYLHQHAQSKPIVTITHALHCAINHSDNIIGIDAQGCVTSCAPDHPNLAHWLSELYQQPVCVFSQQNQRYISW